MCLIVVAFQTAADYPLVVAGNRDEFHSRPAHAANWWADDHDILGGRDLQAGGTWLGVHRSGRLAVVTNYRDAESSRAGKRSRGHLVSDFLRSTAAPLEYLQSLDGSHYAGFNLLVSDGRTLASFSNRNSTPQQLSAGVYGLSNASLDTPWEKVERSKKALQSLVENQAINESELLRILADREKGPVEEVRASHLPFATAHAITAPFVVLPEYGTRCSTVVIADTNDHWSFTEVRFDPSGNRTGESRMSFVRKDRQ